MTYFKPELLPAQAALDAIRGSNKESSLSDGPSFTNIIAAYEVDE
jgi:hypothetical protein